MKFRIYFFLGTLFVFLASCSKNPNPVFFMDTEAEFVIEAGHNTTLTYFYQITDIPTFYEIFSAGSDTSSIVALYPHTAILKPKFQSFDLDFIHNITVDLLDVRDSNKRTELFFMEFIEFGFKEEIRLFNSINDIKDYMQDDRFHIEVAINYRQGTFRTEDFTLEMIFAAYDEE